METIKTLALLSRFIVADITDAKTVLQELQGIVPATHTPVQPILMSGQTEPGMFDFFHLYPWFLPVVEYASADTLLPSLKQLVIDPADDLAERHSAARQDPQAAICTTVSATRGLNRGYRSA
jgi:hypothetical protein